MNESQAAGSFGIVSVMLWLAFTVFMLATMWRIFTKAGKPGWASLIPFYNIYVYLQIAGKPGWWLLLLCIPVVGLIIAILALVGFANNFGKGGGYVVGLIFLPVIFYPMLAFGSAQYQGPTE